MVGVPRPAVTLLLVSSVLCGALAVPHAITTSRGQPRPSSIHHPPRPDHELETQDAGGAPDGGAVESVVFTAGPSPVLYASFSSGAVFRSLNVGRTWTPADRGLPPATPCELAADPQRGDVLYAACIGRLFKTVDGGSRWQQLDVDDAELPLVAPSDSRVVYQPTGDMVSRDGGRSWRVRRRSGEWTQKPVVAVDPRDAQHLVAGSPVGVEDSRDGGIRWKALNTGLGPKHDVQALAIAPLDPRVMIVRTWEATYRTEDGGARWLPIGSPLPPANITQMRFDGDTVQMITVLNQEDLLRTTDGGASWIPLSETLRRPVTTWATHPSNTAVVVAGTTRGVFVSRDNGATWNPAYAGIRRALATVFAGDGARLYAWIDDELLASDDAGRTWTAASNPEATSRRLEKPHARVIEQFAASHREAAGGVAAAPAHPGRFFLGTGGLIARSSIWRSDDNGSSWTMVRLCSDRIAVSCRPQVDPHDPDVVFALTSGEIIDGGATLARSTNAGRNWTEIGPPGSIHHFSLVATIPTTAFASASTGAGQTLYRSADRGTTWTPAGAGLPDDIALTSIVALPANPLHVFAGTRGRGVFESRDGGATWQPLP